MTLEHPGRALLAALVAGAFAGWSPRPIPAAERGALRLALSVATISALRAFRGVTIRALMSYAHKHVVTEAHA
jgi:hypothetical protein